MSYTDDQKYFSASDASSVAEASDYEDNVEAQPLTRHNTAKAVQTHENEVQSSSATDETLSQGLKNLRLASDTAQASRAVGKVDAHLRPQFDVIEPYYKLVMPEANAVADTNVVPDEVAVEGVDPNTESRIPTNVFWTYKLYAGQHDEKVTCHYCTDLAASEKVAATFLNEKLIGFDLEWKPRTSSRKIKDNVSCIQVASESKIAIFHLALFEGDDIDSLLPQSLKKIFEDRAILKAGVWIRGDATRMRKHLDVEMQGLFELSNLYRLVNYSVTDPRQVNRTLVSLSTQVEDTLRLPLSKDSNVRSSNWTKRLNDEQLVYAASDAYAGVQLYHVLDARRRKMQPMPPVPAFAELALPIMLATDREADTPSSGDEEDSSESVSEGSMSSEDVGYSEESAIEEGYELNVGNPDLIEDPSMDILGKPENMPTASKSRGLVKTSKADAQEPPQLREASEWVEDWLTNASTAIKPLSKAQYKDLQAYNLWHVQGHKLPSTAKILGHERGKALSKITVSQYVVRVVKSHRLPCDPDALAEAQKIVADFMRQRGAVVRM